MKFLGKALIFDQGQFNDSIIGRKVIFPFEDCLRRARSLFQIRIEVNVNFGRNRYFDQNFDIIFLNGMSISADSLDVS
jgi:hypothetical protein